MAKKKADHLGDYQLGIFRFEHLKTHFKQFQSKEFQKRNEKSKNADVNEALCVLIQKCKTPCFLLPAVLDYIDQINQLHILESYAFFHFELWLNQFSDLSAEENYTIRAKIAGKWIHRDEYQVLFPIGMGKSYPGSHVVTAHGSPDLDTTIASFWGWLDAFSARVAQGLHLWNIPGGAPVSQIEVQLFFQQIFGERVFDLLAKNRTTLALSGIDLMTQKGLVCKQTEDSILLMEHEQIHNAVLLLDKEGYYVGDWHSRDLEDMQRVNMLLNACLHAFESDLHVKLITLFAKEKLTQKDATAFQEIFSAKLSDCPLAKKCTEKQRTYLHNYLSKIFHLKKGLECTWKEFAHGLQEHSLPFQAVIDLIAQMPKSSLFDRKGSLTENRPQIFHYLKKIIHALDEAMQSMHTFVERLGVALNIKNHVFGYLPQHVNYRADVEEIKAKMGDYPYLSVTATSKTGKVLPLGIIHAHDMHKPILGTVTLRDFCNREETKIPSYFEVISVIDHHKTHLNTTAAPLVTIADTQSSNVLCAEMAFIMNDRYTTGGMSEKEVNEQAKELGKNLGSAESKRLMKRLIQKQLTLSEQTPYFVDPQREYLEYLHFLYGILDDTDLLTKVSQRDLECVAKLLNRLKSIMLKRQVEVITLSDIPRDRDFIANASQRILQNADMYSLYRKIYLAKEDAVEENIALCAKGKHSTFFIDTKEQSGCARVGQSKLFARNFPTFAKHSALLHQYWYTNSTTFHHDRAEVDLYIQMISTIAGADDLFAGKEGNYSHQDELWFWIPFTESSIEHLKRFLNAFRSSPAVQGREFSAEFLGKRADDYAQIFAESFLPLHKKTRKNQEPSITILKFKAGLLNSRKAMISPYLPKPVE